MNNMIRRSMKKINRGQKGITGLETAIILIAFVVVASVFAYTVLSAGLFATQEGQEAIHSGLEESQSTIEVKGEVIATGMGELATCDDFTDWDDVGNITEADSGDPKMEGEYSLSLLATSDISATTVIASYTLPVERDLSGNSTIDFWIMCTEAKAGSDLEFGIVDGGVTDNWQAVGALTADVWTKVSFDLSLELDADCDEVTDIQLQVNDNNLTSGETVYLDIVETQPVLAQSDAMPAYADTLEFTICNATAGEPIDCTEPNDANGDGIIDSDVAADGAQNHKMIVSYTDSYQQYQDLAYTVTQIGKTDGDDLLEAGETFKITVDLSYINNNADYTADPAEKIDRNNTFRLEVKPQVGAVLILQQTMPAVVKTINYV